MNTPCGGMTVAVAGLGLIGGSMAKALAGRTPHTVLGYDRSAVILEQAIADGGVHRATEDFSTADVILVALYPGDTVEFVKTHIDKFRSGALVVDLCGVKRLVCDAVAPLFVGSRAVFLGGHPMAGRECSGYANATADLFVNASMILTPTPGAPVSAMETARALFLSLGFGHIEITSPEKHDAMIAYTSQLAHVVSSAYVQSPEALDYKGFSAGSWRDLTRVAKLNEAMWTELFLCNRDCLADQIDVIIDNLALFRDAIRRGDETALRELLRRGRELKEALEQ